VIYKPRFLNELRTFLQRPQPQGRPLARLGA